MLLVVRGSATVISPKNTPDHYLVFRSLKCSFTCELVDFKLVLIISLNYFISDMAVSTVRAVLILGLSRRVGLYFEVQLHLNIILVLSRKSPYLHLEVVSQSREVFAHESLVFFSQELGRFVVDVEDVDDHVDLGDIETLLTVVVHCLHSDEVLCEMEHVMVTELSLPMCPHSRLAPCPRLPW